MTVLKGWILAASLVASLAAASPAVAAEAMPAMAASDAAPKSGCAYQPIDIRKYGMQPLVAAPVIASGPDHVLSATLKIAYADATIAGCAVHLRMYNGALVGPTLKVRRGDTMKITLRNDLPDGGMKCPMEHSNTPGGAFNITNLHTHGLHVSPSGISDNVLLQICPGKSQDYVIEVPKDQPPGTFWYHAHVHGSTALQVSSGMAGALIVQGGLDDVPAIKAMTEQIMLLQQITYDEQGVIESYGVFGPGEWTDSMRSVTVNGQIAPLIVLRPGEVQRWRFIHGGVRETLPLVMTDGQPLYEIATDGMAIGHMDAWTQGLELDPGYRSDVLYRAPPLPAGQSVAYYYVYSRQLVGRQSLQFLVPAPSAAQPSTAAVSALLTARSNAVVPPGVIAVIKVAGDPVDMKLPTDAELAPLVPFKPITDRELTGEPQHVSFSIQNAICRDPGKPCTVPCDTSRDKDCTLHFMVNLRPYSDAFVRRLKLWTASKWTVETSPQSLGPEHPFHIHVNPFEMTRLDPAGKPETVWKDTLLVHAGAPQELRSRYKDFDGEFVLHCHILDHEDQGMMELVAIVK